MPSRFSRSFKLFQLLFPGAFEAGQPASVDNVVTPVWDSLAMRLGECRVITETTGTIALAAQQLAFTSSVPPAGYVHIPLLLSVYHESAAAVQMNWNINYSATITPDPWGTIANDTVFGESVFTGIGPVIYQPLHLPPLITRGNSITFQSTALITSANTRVDYMYVLAPGELVIFQALGRGI